MLDQRYDLFQFIDGCLEVDRVMNRSHTVSLKASVLELLIEQDQRHHRHIRGERLHGRVDRLSLRLCSYRLVWAVDVWQVAGTTDGRFHTLVFASQRPLLVVPAVQHWELIEEGFAEGHGFFLGHDHTIVRPSSVHELASAHTVQEAEVHRFCFLALVLGHFAGRLVRHPHGHIGVDILTRAIEVQHRLFTSEERSHTKLHL